LRLTKIHVPWDGLQVIYKGEDFYPYRSINKLSEDGYEFFQRSDKVVREYIPYPDSVLKAEGEEILKEVENNSDGWGSYVPIKHTELESEVLKYFQRKGNYSGNIDQR
jgi:hypothetical protein